MKVAEKSRSVMTDIGFFLFNLKRLAERIAGEEVAEEEWRAAPAAALVAAALVAAARSAAVAASGGAAALRTDFRRRAAESAAAAAKLDWFAVVLAVGRTANGDVFYCCRAFHPDNVSRR